MAQHEKRLGGVKIKKIKTSSGRAGIKGPNGGVSGSKLNKEVVEEAAAVRSLEEALDNRLQLIRQR